MINFLRNYTHTFRRFLLTSTLNFCGLVIALCAFYLFMTKLDSELRYNHCFEDYQKIYRVELEGSMFGEDSIRIANVVAPLSDIAKRVKHVEDAATEPLVDDEINFYRDGKFVTSIPSIGGYGKQLNFWRKGIAPDTLSPDYPLYGTNRDGMIIPKSFAMKWFGTADAVGKELKWEMDGDTYSFKVVSVYDDFPKNCCVRNAMYRYGLGYDSLSYNNYNYHVYAKVDDEKNVPYVEERMLEYLLDDMLRDSLYSDEEIQEMRNSTDGVRVSLTPIYETYFSTVDEVWDTGDVNIISILFISAILVLVIMNVNMMNYSLAQAPFRMKNINTRRVFGASRYSLMFMLIFESLLVSVIAFGVSMLLLHAANYVNIGNIAPLDHLNVVCLTFVAAIIIGWISGLYPAYYATSLPPAIAMKGLKDIPMRSRRLRNIRIAFQLLISYIAVECVMMYLLQVVFIYTLDYGYKKDQIIYGTLNSIESVSKKDSLRAELLKLDDVENVSYSRFAIGTGDRYMLWSRNPRVGEAPILFTVLPVDKDYINTMGIDMLKGRGFTDADSCGAFIVNEAAVKKYGWIEVNKLLYKFEEGTTNYPVVGVCPNLRVSSLRKNDDELPMLFMYTTDSVIINMYSRNANVMNIRVSEGADMKKVQRKINDKYMEMFPVELELSLVTLNDTFDKLYYNEFVFFLHTCVFAAIYLLLTLIGVSSTITFENEYHRKEVGIRRVFGASIWDITFIKAHIYLTQLVVCFLASIPFVNAVSDIVLKGFTKLSPHLWLAYPLSFIFVSLLGLSIILVQRYIYAKEKPVKSLYNE